MRCWSIPMRWWSGSRARITGDAWRPGGSGSRRSCGGGRCSTVPVVGVEGEWRRVREPFLFNGGGGVMRRSKVPPLVAQNSLLSWMARYRVPILPCGSRAQAARVVLQHFDMVDRIKKEEKKRRTGG